MSRLTDERQLKLAADDDRVMITPDDDVIRLHQRWMRDGKSHAGILYLMPHVQGRRGANTVISAITRLSELSEDDPDEDLHNKVCYIS